MANMVLVTRTLSFITPIVALRLVIGRDGMMSRAALPYTRDNMMPGIRILINILRLRQNGRHFIDEIFQHIFLNENVRIWMKISL